ncbi:unnamed protein product, partial [Staurois parvus]
SPGPGWQFPADIRQSLGKTDREGTLWTCCFVSICTACLPSKTQHTVKHTQQLVKQHTVNPLIAPDVNPFLPSVISSLSVLFLALITVLVSMGMSAAVS